MSFLCFGNSSSELLTDKLCCRIFGVADFTTATEVAFSGGRGGDGGNVALAIVTGAWPIVVEQSISEEAYSRFVASKVIGLSVAWRRTEWSGKALEGRP